jgi:hypothetical protein
MATSNTTNFDLNIDDVINEGFERCGLSTNSGFDLKTARRSLNILFSEWGNRGIHLWKVKQHQQLLVNGQATYATPTDCSDVLEAFVSSSGAANGTLSTALTSSATSIVLTDGSAFGTSGTIKIQSEYITYTGKSTHTLTGATRGALGSTAVAHSAGLEVQNVSGQGDSDTQDVAITKIDRSAYSALPNKLSKGQPSQYYVRRDVNPTITLYTAPDTTTYTYLKYFYIGRIEDAGAYSNTPDVVYRFLPCMCAGLAYYLAMKKAPAIVQQNKLIYEDELKRALDEDGQRTSTYISPQIFFPEGV